MTKDIFYKIDHVYIYIMYICVLILIYINMHIYKFIHLFMSVNK